MLDECHLSLFFHIAYEFSGVSITSLVIVTLPTFFEATFKIYLLTFFYIALYVAFSHRKSSASVLS